MYRVYIGRERERERYIYICIHILYGFGFIAIIQGLRGSFGFYNSENREV